MEQLEEGGVVKVKLDHAVSLPEDQKTVPVFVVEMPQPISDQVSNFVLIDGLHRTVRHILDGDETIKVQLVSRPEDLCRFHYHKVGGKAFDVLGRNADVEKIELKYYWAGR